jgi:hypothetical protein
VTYLDLITNALSEIGVARAGDVLSPEDANFALGILGRMLDEWNADRRAVYASVLAPYTTTGVSPHTIGPAGATFTVAQRPVSLEGATRLESGVRTPLTIQTRPWWLAQSMPALGGTVTDVYYEPDWPLGKLYFWPVPSGVQVELLTSVLLDSTLALTDDFSLPPGYQGAIEKSLAEECATPFGQEVSAKLEKLAAAARARIFGNNDAVHPYRTRDAGMPCGGGGSTFNYRTRS